MLKRMMKIFAAFVVIAIAVSVEAIKYKVPDLPCAYDLTINEKEDGKITDSEKLTVCSARGFLVGAMQIFTLCIVMISPRRRTAWR